MKIPKPKRWFVWGLIGVVTLVGVFAIYNIVTRPGVIPSPVSSVAVRDGSPPDVRSEGLDVSNPASKLADDTASPPKDKHARYTWWMDRISAKCHFDPPSLDEVNKIPDMVAKQSDEVLQHVLDTCPTVADYNAHLASPTGAAPTETGDTTMYKPFAAIFLAAGVAASSPPAALAGDVDATYVHEGHHQVFAEVFGIPKGFHNAGIRTPQKTECSGRLVLDLNNCGVDPDGRKWCKNKCEP